MDKLLENLSVAVKELQWMETKAGVINTAEQNHGKEIVRLDEQSHTLLDLLPTYSKLLPLLPWNHGTNMAMQERLPMIWEAAKFTGNSEWTSWTTSFTASATQPKTAEATIVQGQFILEIPVSKREANYEFVNLESILRDRIAQSFARTIDDVLLNGDKASTWNVNGTYDSTAAYAQCDNGIRKVAIANGVVSIGTLDAPAHLDIVSVLDDWYQTDLDNLLFIESSNVYLKTLQLDEVMTNDKFGPSATIHTGVLAKIWNIDIITMRDYPSKTATSGKVTGSSDATWSICLLWKPAVQYGYGQPLEIEITKVAGRGYVLTATAEFGFTIVNNDSNAGVGKTVAMWANITL